jgi:hypothetical protein
VSRSPTQRDHRNQIWEAHLVLSSTAKITTTSYLEVKFVDVLSLEHAIQAAIYGYLWHREHKNRRFPQVVLFNVRSGEKWIIESTPENMKALVEGLIRIKYTLKKEESEQSFLTACKTAKDEVFASLKRGEAQIQESLTVAQKWVQYRHAEAVLESEWKTLKAAHEALAQSWKLQCNQLRAEGMLKKNLPSKPQRPLRPRIVPFARFENSDEVL